MERGRGAGGPEKERERVGGETGSGSGEKRENERMSRFREKCSVYVKYRFRVHRFHASSVLALFTNVKFTACRFSRCRTAAISNPRTFNFARDNVNQFFFRKNLTE